MAWLKEWTDESTGVTASYWENISSRFEKRSGVTEICDGVWISQEAYDANLSPLHTEITIIQSEDNKEIKSLKESIDKTVEIVTLAKEELKDAKKVQKSEISGPSPAVEVQPIERVNG